LRPVGRFYMSEKLSYRECLKQRRAWYKTVGAVECPILTENVVFTSKGFHHLKYDGSGRGRKVKDHHRRLTVLPYSVDVIKNATSIYEYKKNIYSKALGKYVDIWELRAVVGPDKESISVVLRRIGTGNIAFYSVWKNNGKHKATKKIKKSAN